MARRDHRAHGSDNEQSRSDANREFGVNDLQTEVVRWALTPTWRGFRRLIPLIALFAATWFLGLLGSMVLQGLYHHYAPAWLQ